MLYQLSYTPIFIPFFCGSGSEREKADPISTWWTVRDSNPGPTGYEPAALPTALTVLEMRASEKRKAATKCGGPPLAPQVGLEPTTPRLTAACSTD